MEKEDITNASPHVENAQGADKVDILEAELSPDARGYDLGEMPKGYYTSWRFIGSVAAISFLAQGLYLGSCQLDPLWYKLTCSRPQDILSLPTHSL